VKLLVQYCAWDQIGVGLGLSDADGDGIGQYPGPGLQAGLVGL
jgi:hypothetical protein